MYEIKVLSDKEFFEVAKSDKRYEYVDEENLGFADPVKGKAYVRHVAHPELQKYLINHELEELVEAHEGHEDPNGIRHKKFWSNLFSSIFGGGGKQEQPQQQQYQPPSYDMSGSYAPQSGSYGNPMNLFTSGSYSPGQTPDVASGGSVGGNLSTGLADLPDYMKERKFGAESGTIAF